MTGYDLTEAMQAAVQALRVAGLADADGDGYVLENVYADGAVHVAITAALPHLEQQIREQVAAEAKAEALREAAVIMRSCKDPGHWNLRDPRDPEVSYSPDVWLETRADQIAGADQ